MHEERLEVFPRLTQKVTHEGRHTTMRYEPRNVAVFRSRIWPGFLRYSIQSSPANDLAVRPTRLYFTDDFSFCELNFRPIWHDFGSRTVLDPDDLRVSGAEIILKNAPIGFSHTMTTGEDGSYQYVQLIPGTYKLTVSKRRIQSNRDFFRSFDSCTDDCKRLA
jgi:hypothetical protein